MHIRPVERPDLPDIATFSIRAYMDDELFLWLSPQQRQHPHIARERYLRALKRNFNTHKIMLVMVTDESDEVWDGRPRMVAYAAYAKEVGATDDSSKVGATWSRALERALYWVEENYNWYFRNYLDTDKQRIVKLEKVFNDCAEYDNHKKYWELLSLVTDPSFSRRGLASQLLVWGQQRATEDNVPLITLSSYAAEPLYTKMGFRQMTRVVIDEGLDSAFLEWHPPVQAPGECEPRANTA